MPLTTRPCAHSVTGHIPGAMIVTAWRVRATAEEFDLPPDGVPFDVRLLTEGRAEWLREVGVEAGTPFLVSPVFEYDVVLNRFFRSPGMRMHAVNTQFGYARDLAAFLTFLWQRVPAAGQCPAAPTFRAAADAPASETGRSPSVLALATRLGLAHTTFRRNFPDICAELAAAPMMATASKAVDNFTAVKADNARLHRDKRELAEQVELAIAAIQPLSVDNDRLRTALHEARSIAPLPRRPR